MAILTTCTELRVRAGSKNWLAQRKTGIGASEIAMALGIAPPTWGSPTTLYYRKRDEYPDQLDNARMQWGSQLEAAIIKRFLKCHPEFRGGHVLTGRLYRSKEREWQLATPDAVVFDTRRGFHHDTSPTSRTSAGRPVVVQVKTGSSNDGWGEEGTDEIPVYYRAQVMQEMDVVGADVAWVPVLFNGRDYREYRVRRHPADLRVLRARGAEFWQRVLDGNPPKVDGHEATAKALRHVYGVDAEVRVQVPADLVLKIERAKAVEKRAGDLTRRLQNELRVLMEDAGVGMAGAAPVARRTEYTQRVVNLDGLREEHPELVEKHTTQVKRQRITTTTKELK